MNNFDLSTYFVGAVGKILSRVEVEENLSNQHEFNGVSSLKHLLGEERTTFSSVFLYMSDDSFSEPIIRDTGTLTWYDAREAHPTRSEFRLYFSSNRVMDEACAGDYLVIALRTDGTLVTILTPSESDMCSYICTLFDLKLDNKFSISSQKYNKILTYSKKLILDSLGIEVYNNESKYLPEMLRLFNGDFPSTKVFSEYARSTLNEIDGKSNADSAVLKWMEREEGLFRTLERFFVDDRIKDGFSSTDEFLSYALSLLNRRKSRVGHALENHLEQIFKTRDLKHVRTCVTENQSRPDFLFPSASAYHDQNLDAEFLTMLGVKTTCKDRWRQVISEAARIKSKHLLTLEEGISEGQTDEMISHNIQLVVPEPLHDTYTAKQQKWLITLEQFIELVQDKQDRFILLYPHY